MKPNIYVPDLSGPVENRSTVKKKKKLIKSLYGKEIKL
jgi:hypothetical protein